MHESGRVNTEGCAEKQAWQGHEAVCVGNTRKPHKNTDKARHGSSTTAARHSASMYYSSTENMWMFWMYVDMDVQQQAVQQTTRKAAEYDTQRMVKHCASECSSTTAATCTQERKGRGAWHSALKTSSARSLQRPLLRVFQGGRQINHILSSPDNPLSYQHKGRVKPRNMPAQAATTTYAT